MKCPFCAFQENKVIDSRLSKDGAVIRRRRECNDCSKRFTTYERIEEVMPQVIKRDGRREPFEHGTLLKSLEVACEKRPVPMARIENLVDELEKQLQDTGEKEIESSLIVDEVLIRLSEVDDLAYVRYATRYRTYADLGELARELSDIVTQRGQGAALGLRGGEARPGRPVPSTRPGEPAVPSTRPTESTRPGETPSSRPGEAQGKATAEKRS